MIQNDTKMATQENKNQKRYLCFICKKFKSQFVAIIKYDEEFARKYFKNKMNIYQCSDCLKIQSEKNPDYNLKVIKHIVIL